MKQKLIIGLGSNWESETHIQRANKLLKDYFEEIHFSEAIYTVPIELQDSALFLNQVAIAYTNYSMEVVQAELKEMERNLGRNLDSKKQGIIPIDIDLLQWNDLILKPQDLERDYIKQGIASITC